MSLSQAQADVKTDIFMKQYSGIQEQREAFMQWLQAHARDVSVHCPRDSNPH